MCSKNVKAKEDNHKKVKEEMEARQKNILQKSDNILGRFNCLFDESTHASAEALNQECQQFKTSTEDDIQHLTELVESSHNDDRTPDMVKQVGESVLKARSEMLFHLEYTTNQMRMREDKEKERNSKIQEAFERKRIQLEELEEQHRLQSVEKENLIEKLSDVKDKLSDVLEKYNSLRTESDELEEQLSLEKESIAEELSDVREKLNSLRTECNEEKERNSKIQEALQRKRMQLSEQHRELSLEKESLAEELSDVKEELSDVREKLNSFRSESDEELEKQALEKERQGDELRELRHLRSESEDHISELQRSLRQSEKSLAKVTEDLIRTKEALHNLEPLRLLNENLTKDIENLQRNVKALEEDQALQTEKERLFSSLKNHMAEKLEEKEVAIAEKNGQLKVLRKELSQEKERVHYTEEQDVITLDVPFNKRNRMLEQRISEQRKKLASCIREKERLNSEVKQHTVNLTMIKSGINQLISDPSTPSSMIHSLKVLRHSSMFSLADIKEGPLAKKVKVEGSCVKEEYFEDVNVKKDTPSELETEQCGPTDQPALEAQTAATGVAVDGMLELQVEGERTETGSAGEIVKTMVDPVPETQ